MRVTGPLFKWFGSKWNASKKYPAPLQGSEIKEPFAGGAGYSLRHSENRVWIAESNPLVHELWKWIIEEADQAAVLDIPLDIPEKTDVRTLGLSRGQQLLLKHWQRTNNVGNCWTVSPWGNKPGQWTANTRSRVAEEIYAVKHWKLFSDGFALMNQGGHATWFVDPPYQFNYDYKIPILDYEALSNCVRSLEGRVIVCEAICPKTGARPAWLPFVDFARTVTSRRKKEENHHSNELLYTMDT